MEGRQKMRINWKVSARHRRRGIEATSQMVAVSAWRNTSLARIPVRATGCLRTHVCIQTESSQIQWAWCEEE